MADAVNLEVGSKSPIFDTVDSKGIRHNLADLTESGEKVILYFYPRDSTPGCTTQACDFSDNLA